MKKLISVAAALALLLSLPVRAGADSIFDLMADEPICYEVDLIGYYLDEMRAAAVAGDPEAGAAAEQSRNSLIDRNGSTEGKICFADLYLLARLISAEAGCNWLSEDFRMCVGEVVLNRVASPEYPNSIREVVYQKGQYSSVNSPGFDSLVPKEECVDIALRLLQGERKMVESVVFQSNTIQGDPFMIFTDHTLGTTYFCVSANQELYPLG